ncbi:1-deoxy-D-xylulose-5-phosphate synthase [Lachnospira eligens]|jgi:1-deoxy-D-xylulose-5-phosphate synthase|uniref:1-deoxy-D-xylulose-5-phosphate synthase n=1 Tax=Lachnospira eligens TaxID=39485 RepID=A0A414DDD8_9FIRM|nr:1-deoxy-D-xylulose-5-phosphate synthase [Lachnospira eligens]MBS5259979.1 1-deoxy-D-xylulose-5-phosphate synthase [Lachnospira eligens]RHD08578.1 1-deoxy-D-xylulose-5-phosphate synthase [Lachnospira eligens]RHI68142.1 1-deoxy-D-xylulose-5-phosphate synthase [Lachnospira eligens]
MYIENINSPADVKKLNILQLNVLAEEMRHALLTRASRHGGHFGPNFGMVEAIIAMHYVFDSPKDKIVFDVSHQCYPHKMLTGRKDAYLYEEHYDDVSGYTNPDESEHDFFTVGHTSTSISLACGLAKARDLNGEDGNVIAVIGDGSLSGGEALEGLDFASELNSNMIIVANDNDMSIAENHGGLYGNLKLLRETNGQAECNLFKAMNLDYIYVDKGNDIASLIEAFEKVKDTKKAVVVHINTLKGKGYAPAEQNKEKWHWHMPFDIATGESLFKDEEPDFSDASLEYLLKKMDEDKSVVAITAGTPTVMGFTADMRAKAGKQFVDVGIAEETAVALASGIAANGGKPVFGVYSSFIQRAYDQITQDVCINGNAVTFAVFAGSVYGMNDVTHLGLQDIPMLNSIPGLVYLAPVTKEDYIAMLDWSLTQNEYPVAIKVPGGRMVSTGTPVTKDFSKLGTYEVTKKGSRVAILGLGTFYETAVKAADILKTSHGIDATVINPYYISGIDADTLNELKEDHAVVATLEDGYLEGGFGAKIAAYYGSSDMKVLNFGIKKEFIDRYDVAEVLKDNHLTPEQIAEDIAATL